MGNTFKISTPEAQGIPSKAIMQVLDILEAYDIPMHSFLIMRHGHLVCDAFWSPYTKDTFQRMYSVTKSFVSLAIGALVTEKRISLDDPIVDYFPDKLVQPVPSQLKRTTIRHMLTMSSCHRMTTYKMTNDPDWTRTFFTIPPDHEPGSFFMYDTSASQVLGALVERLTGQKLIDYVRGTVLAKSGFSENAYILEDPSGVSSGGSGLMATSYDILYAIQAITDKDNPYHLYFQDACKKHIETAFAGFGSQKDLSQGYGYYIWRFAHDSFGFFGMGGQLAIAIPKYDMFIVTTAFAKEIEGGLQRIMDALWSLLPTLSPIPLPKSKDSETLQQRITTLSLKHVQGNYTIPDSVFSWEGTYTCKDNSYGLQSLGLHFGESSCSVKFIFPDNSLTLEVDLGNLKIQPWVFDSSTTCALSGAFNEDGNLCISAQLLWPELGVMRLWIACDGKQISLRITETVEKEQAKISGVFTGEK